MNRINYKIIIIGFLVAWVITIPLILILTILPFDWTETFLRRFIPLTVQFVAAGIYVGITKAQNKILHAAFVGLLIEISIRTYAYIKTSIPPGLNLVSFSMSLKYIVVCVAVAWLTGKIRTMKRQNKEAINTING